MDAYYIGIDWADAAHAACVVDAAGEVVWTGAIVHTAAGLAAWRERLEGWRVPGREIAVAIERPDGLLVEQMLAQGVPVYPVNPKALDRARDRFRVSGAKSDPFDAEVLAQWLRTDHAQWVPLQPQSAPAQELRLLTEDHQRLVRERTRLVNQVTATLKAYYPRALELWPDLTTASARGFLRAYPTPDALTAGTRAQWERFTRRQRMASRTRSELWARLRVPQIPVPPHLVRAKASLLGALLDQLDAVIRHLADYQRRIEDFFGSLPAAAWARTLPASQSGTTVATLWAQMGDAPGRWASWHHLQAHAGTVPITRTSGQQHSVRFRRACDHLFRAAMDRYAFLSMRQSEWARAYYRQQRARGHRHHRALRALAAKWLKILFVLWQRQEGYDETRHLAMIARQHLRAAAA